MSVIQPLGRLLRMDDEGFLVNDCDIARVPAAWRPLVEATVGTYVRHLGDNLHSVWLRGSVAKGQPVPGISDLDTFALVHGEPDVPVASWAEAEQPRLKALQPACMGVEMWTVPVAVVLEAARGGNEGVTRSARLGVLVELLSACAWGEDIRAELPRSRPDATLVRRCWDLDRGVEEFERALLQDEDRRGLWTWILRHVLRCAQVLVVEREGAFGRDLYPCWESFARHYPAWRDRSRRALEQCIVELESPAEPEAAITLAREFAAFLGEEYERLYGEGAG